MKTTSIRPLFVIVCLLSALRFANAQGCRLDYTPEYSMYQNESTDGTNIYTSVVVDGSTVGEPSASCNETSAIHTPKAYNVIGSTGGWLTGSSVYMTSYVEVENDQEVDGSTGAAYIFYAEGEIYCSVFGEFWGVTLPDVNIKIRRTYWGPPPTEANGHCYWTILACTNNTTPTCKSVTTKAWLLDPDPGCPSYARGSYLVVNGTCEIAVGFPATAPGGPCT